jgi:SAM-dependent methyltransferase
MPDELDADHFDQWYADMEHARYKDQVEQRHLGLPPELLSTSLLTWEGIAEVTHALRLSSGDVLLDLACGRGGYGMEVANRTAAVLIGVDFSEVAVRQAREQAARRGREADFRVGHLTATGLADDAVDAVMCIDAIQFADPPAAAYRELRRVLRPGGRAVLTCWQAVDPGDESLPRRLRRTDLRAGLEAAGFSDVQVIERPEWLERELAMWAEAAVLDPGDDPALQSLHDEAVDVLGRAGSSRRYLASAVA